MTELGEPLNAPHAFACALRTTGGVCNCHLATEPQQPTQPAWTPHPNWSRGFTYGDLCDRLHDATGDTPT